MADSEVRSDGASLSSVLILWMGKRILFISSRVSHRKTNVLIPVKNEHQYYFRSTHLSLWQPSEAYHQTCSPKPHPGLDVLAAKRHVDKQVWWLFKPATRLCPDEIWNTSSERASYLTFYPAVPSWTWNLDRVVKLWQRYVGDLPHWHKLYQCQMLHQSQLHKRERTNFSNLFPFVSLFHQVITEAYKMRSLMTGSFAVTWSDSCHMSMNIMLLYF